MKPGSLVLLLALAAGCHSTGSSSAPPPATTSPTAPGASPTPSVSASSASAPKQHLYLVGDIDDTYDIRMQLDIDGTSVTGTYLYVFRGLPLKLTGRLTPGGKLELRETDTKGKHTGTFRGDLASDGQHFEGTWTGTSGAALSAHLRAPGVAARDDGSAEDLAAKIVAKTYKFRHEKKEELTIPYTIRYPVVALPNPAAEQRINAELAPKKLLADYDAEWLWEADYTVHVNRHGVLDITVSGDGCGAYPSGFYVRHAFDLETGRSLKAKDLFRPEGMSALVKRVDREVQRELERAVARSGTDADACGKEMYKQYEVHFTKKNLDDFDIGPKGVTFHHSFGFPHVAQACELPGAFLIRYAELAPYVRLDSPLARFLPKQDGGT